MRVQLLKERPTTIKKSYDQVIPSVGDGGAELMTADSASQTISAGIARSTAARKNGAFTRGGGGEKNTDVRPLRSRLRWAVSAGRRLLYSVCARRLRSDLAVVVGGADGPGG